MSQGDGTLNELFVLLAIATVGLTTGVVTIVGFWATVVVAIGFEPLGSTMCSVTGTGSALLEAMLGESSGLKILALRSR